MQMDVSCYRRRPKEPKLLFPMIIEILSWLPVESLLRFKSVNKNWSSSMEEYSFISKHMNRTRPVRLKYRLTKQPGCIALGSEENYECKFIVAGLVLEKHSSSQACRIRNPATHQVLYLPDAHVGVNLMVSTFNSSTGEVKLVTSYRENNEVGFEVLTVGKDENWRPLKHPNQGLSNKQAKIRQFLLADKADARVCYCAETLTDGEDMYLEVHCLDLWSETFMTATLPGGVFSDLSKARVISWNQSIAVVDIIDEALHALVLEDFKEQKWSRYKNIVPVKFLKQTQFPEGESIVPSSVDSDELRFIYNNGQIVLMYDMKTHKVKSFIRRRFDGEGWGNHRPSLMSFKGMRPEEEGAITSTTQE
ncbi:F-box protein [Prunus yedoensis var. nudiflora]|uniref:F-box protein n=1 Tax=Prunus yedoensis var. nudiflora TaxID=2094558 RepID=A0A315ALY2_PRUYE|nr:F-box protein [Prunus yedoensis var. nudiflora]